MSITHAISQESFDTVLSQFGVFGEDVAFHNATLIGVAANDATGGTRLMLLIGDQQIITRTPGAFAEFSAKHLVEKIGHVGVAVRANEFVDGRMTPCRDAVFFRPYIDQTLRRRPEIDIAAHKQTHRNEATVGWSCEARGLFHAPPGITPGEHGQYVPDTTELLTLRVPAAFAELCQEYGMSPEKVLSGFMADAAGLDSYVSNPRADGISSNGSDERDQAAGYVERAWGHRREEAAAWNQYREEAQEREENVAEVIDCVRELADDYQADPAAMIDLLDANFRKDLPRERDDE